MIFSFKIVSDEVDDFRREIQIDADATFLDLRNAICDSVGYTKDDMCSFFLCDDNWEKEREITLADMGSDSSQEVYLMDETVLSDYIDKGQRLIFVFDYLTDRSFFLEMKKSLAGKNLDAPICVTSVGKAPSQTVDLDEFDSKIDLQAKSGATSSDEDFDEEFYGSSDYNDDEFDAAGYDEISYDDI